MITIKSDFDAKEIMTKLNLFPLTSKDLRDVAELIIDDITGRIDSGLDVQDRPFIPNTQKWIKRKGNSTVFLGKTKKLLNNIKIKSQSKNSITISVKSNGLWWQFNPRSPYYKRDLLGLNGSKLKAKIGDFLRGKYGR